MVNALMLMLMLMLMPIRITLRWFIRLMSIRWNEDHIIYFDVLGKKSH